MLDFLSSKKSKKEEDSSHHHSSSKDKNAAEEPVLDDDNQSFLESLTSWSDADDVARLKIDDGDDVSQRPPLPPRLKTPDLTWDSDSESFVREEVVTRQAKSRGIATDEKKHSSSSGGGVGRRLSALLKNRHSDHSKAETGTVATVSQDTPLHAPVPTSQHGDHPHAAHLAVPGHVDADSGVPNISSDEEKRENADLSKVLDDLQLAMKGGKGSKGNKGSKVAVALSAESAELVRKFVLVLKDLVNGVPTAADDLRHLLDDRDGTLAKGFDRLPKSLRKLVAQLPNKLTASLGPEILAAAAETQGIKVNALSDDGKPTSTKSAAKAALLPLITKPTALIKMLKAIMNALKLRWPAFAGTSAIWSVALFLLMFVLWYCHKRGREVRLEKEGQAAGTEGEASTATTSSSEPGAPPREKAAGPVENLPQGELPPPPVGKHAHKK